VLIYESELIFVPLCITPSESQNTVTITFLAVEEHRVAVLFLVLQPSLFCPAIYSAPIDCSIAINTAKPFTDVPPPFLSLQKGTLIKACCL
jgi:hypothetical protein